MSDYRKEIEVRWSDIDQNGHVRHSAYYDYGAFARISFINDAGFGTAEYEAVNIGPILFKEECSFIKEIRPSDKITINVMKGDLAPDGSRWVLHHELYNQKDQKVAHITVKGAWLDLKTRKLAVPPVEMLHAFEELPEGKEFVYGK